MSFIHKKQRWKSLSTAVRSFSLCCLSICGIIGKDFTLFNMFGYNLNLFIDDGNLCVIGVWCKVGIYQIKSAEKVGAARRCFGLNDKFLLLLLTTNLNNNSFMKRLFLLLAAACIGLTSCSETLSAEDQKLEEIKKKFDFSDVDIESIQGLQEETKFSTSDLTVFTGTIDDCAWVGVFDSQSGSLQCQYTDVDHPVSYSAYGEEHKYKVGDVLSTYFENKQLTVVMRYAESQYDDYNNTRAKVDSRTDLISVTGDSHYRHIIDEKSSCSSSSIMKWANRSIYILLKDSNKGVIYDADNNIILCRAIGNSGYIENDNDHNLIISQTNVLHFWKLFFCSYDSSIALRIEEFQCTYDTISSAEKFVKIFDLIQDDSSKAPRFSHEYKIRTDNHITAVFTKTDYDGTVTTKTVDIRVENDELKVDIQ